MSIVVNQIKSPASVQVGEVSVFEALVAGDLSADDLRCIDWTVRERPGGPERPLGRGPSVGYSAPLYAAGSGTITVTAAPRGGAKASFDIAVQPPSGYIVPTTKVVVTVMPSAVVDAGKKKEKHLYHASVGAGGVNFLVGREQRSSKAKDGQPLRRGLSLAGSDCVCHFNPDDFRASHGAWVDLIAPTAACEGQGAMEALNTYDEANFSFGMIQFAANSYGADLYEFLRRLLISNPDVAAFYFPEFAFKNEFIAIDPVTGVSTTLTSKKDRRNLKLRAYLKPDKKTVTAQEIGFAARLIHWMRADVNAREIMVAMAVERAQGNLANRKLVDAKGHSVMDGQDIGVCAMVYDILVQGRGGTIAKRAGKTLFQIIAAAAATSKPMDALANICDGPYEKSERDRVKSSLRPAIERMQAQFPLVYDAKSKNFVAKGAAS